MAQDYVYPRDARPLIELAVSLLYPNDLTIYYRRECLECQGL